MKIAVVILNWNGKTLLERFLPDVVHYSKEAKIYVADNASTDDSVRFCETYYPDTITVIKNAENGGYAKGYNDALKQVIADLYILLNSDVRVTENWMTPLIKAFALDENLAAAQPKIKDLQKPTHFEYAGAAGGFLDSLGYPFCRGRIFNHCEEDKGQYNDTIDIQWASGACLFVRSTIFWEVGGFDEHFFAHQEEIDLCWRIKNKEYRIICNGESSVYHLGGATLETANPRKAFYNFRNSMITVVKNAPKSRYAYIIIARLFLDGLAGLKFLSEAKPKHTLAIINAHFSFYRHLRSCLKKRTLQTKPSYAQYSSIIYAYFLKGIKSYAALLEKR